MLIKNFINAIKNIRFRLLFEGIYIGAIYAAFVCDSWDLAKHFAIDTSTSIVILLSSTVFLCFLFAILGFFKKEKASGNFEYILSLFSLSLLYMSGELIYKVWNATKNSHTGRYSIYASIFVIIYAFVYYKAKLEKSTKSQTQE